MEHGACSFTHPLLLSTGILFPLYYDTYARITSALYTINLMVYLRELDTMTSEK